MPVNNPPDLFGTVRLMLRPIQLSRIYPERPSLAARTGLRLLRAVKFNGEWQLALNHKKR